MHQDASTTTGWIPQLFLTEKTFAGSVDVMRSTARRSGGQSVGFDMYAHLGRAVRPTGEDKGGGRLCAICRCTLQLYRRHASGSSGIEVHAI